MSERLHSLGAHFRRHGIAYAALTVAFSFSPVPSMAADLVTTGQIANGAVTQPKLAADSVVSGKILNETIAGADVKNGSIGTLDISDGTLSGVDVKEGSVTGADIADFSVTRWDIGQDQVDGYNLLDGTITDADLGFGSVRSDAIQDGSITGADINLFNDDRCTLEALMGTALINADPAVPNTYTTAWIGYPHSCSGETVQVRRTSAGQYSITFGAGNPARLAVVTQNTCCGAQASAVISVEALNPGQFFVQTKVNGSYADVDFTIVVF